MKNKEKNIDRIEHDARRKDSSKLKCILQV
jgi:hypothetical protein